MRDEINAFLKRLLFENCFEHAEIFINETFILI